LSKKTFAIAAASQVHLIVQLKANQKSLCHQVKVGCRKAAPSTTCQTTDRHKRNRHETRITTVFDTDGIVSSPTWRDAIAAVITVERIVQRFHPASGLWKRSSDISYYLSNRPIEAALAADAIRRHWHIENRSHHVRDVTFGEDASRIRTNPGVFARLRSFAANILRFNQRSSVRQDRYAAALGGYQALAKLRFS
jgi:predicted transposase YbfD/YdcC